MTTDYWRTRAVNYWLDGHDMSDPLDRYVATSMVGSINRAFREPKMGEQVARLAERMMEQPDADPLVLAADISGELLWLVDQATPDWLRPTIH